MDPAQLLRSARWLSGLSQRELAHRSGVASSVIERIEAGRSVPKWDTVMRLLAAAGLGVQLALPPAELSELDRAFLKKSTSQRLYWALGGQHVTPTVDHRHPLWVPLRWLARSRVIVMPPEVSLGVWLRGHVAAPPIEVVTPTQLDGWGRPVEGATEEVRVSHGPVSLDGLLQVGVWRDRQVWVHPPDHPLLQVSPGVSSRLRAVAACLHEEKWLDEQQRRGAAHKEARVQRERYWVEARHAYRHVPLPDVQDRRDWRLNGEASFREWLDLRGG